MKKPFVVAVMILLMVGFATVSHAQNLLNRNISSLEVRNQRLGDVLEILSNKGNFYFSYNSSIIKKDSLVTMVAYNKSVKTILDFLFKSGYEFKESGNYIIIRRAPVSISIITNKAETVNNYYVVSGVVLDDHTGDRIPDASVYEKDRLASALTNDTGYFKLKLKVRYKTAKLTVSKAFYEDTVVQINTGYNQRLKITIVPAVEQGPVTIISPEDYLLGDSSQVGQTTDTIPQKKLDSAKVEYTGIGKFLLSVKLKAQSVNMKNFFTARPFQVSFVPLISTNGRMNAQVVNKFSLNMLGGYSAGVNGMEIGGLFNINKKSMTGFQMGGLLNLTGTYVNGLQIAGIHNSVLDSVTGVQIAGISNFVSKKVKGWQLAGIYNHANNTMNGVQIGGIANFVNKNATGLQIAGIANTARRRMNGFQISGIINYAQVLNGVQIGLINIADSSNGFSIGLFNFVRKNGYHKISVYSSELMNLNVDLKTGNAKLYSILKASMHISDTAKLYAYGFGLGHDFIFAKWISLSSEISSQYLYNGNWDASNILGQFKLNLNLHPSKYFSVFAGATLNGYFTNAAAAAPGYKSSIPAANYPVFDMGNKYYGWIGWNAGITFF